MKPGQFRRVLLDCLIVAVLGANVAAGSSAFRQTLQTVFQWGGPTISREAKEQIKRIRAFVPERAPIFYIYADPDPDPGPWVSRFWQRVLYPNPVFLVRSPEQLNGPDYARFKTQYSIRYAVSVGTPPLLPSFIRSMNIGPPGAEHTLVVGELAP